MNNTTESPEEDINTLSTEEVTTKTRRSKGSFAKSVSEEVGANIIALYAQGGTIATIANEVMVTPMAVREHLKQAGVLRGRGQGLQRKATRVRKTLAISPEVLAKALPMVQEMGVVKTAKEMSLNAVELSAAVREAGIILQRGPKRKTV